VTDLGQIYAAFLATTDKNSREAHERLLSIEALARLKKAEEGLEKIPLWVNCVEKYLHTENCPVKFPTLLLLDAVMSRPGDIPEAEAWAQFGRILYILATHRLIAEVSIKPLG